MHPKAVGLGICAALLFGTACGADDTASNADVVKIAAPLELTGPTGAFGATYAKAMQVAIDQINDDGGIKSMNGAKLELMLQDSQSDPQRAIQLLRKMDQEEPVVAVGPFGSGAAVAAKPVLKDLGLPYITPAADDSLTEDNADHNIWRIVSRFSEWGESTMDFIEQAIEADEIDVKKIGLVVISVPPGPALSKAVKARAEKLGIEVEEFAYDPANTSDFGSLVARLRSANPDLVMGFSYPQDATRFVQALTLQDWRPEEGFVMTAGAYYLNSFRKSLGAKTAGWIDASYGASSARECPMASELSQKFQEVSDGDPLTGLDTTAPSIIAVIADALERAGSADRDDFRKALADTKLEFCDSTYLLAGDVAFDEKGDNTGYFPTFIQHEGEFAQVSIWPESVAAQAPKWPARSVN